MTSNLNALDPLNATVRARLDQALRDHLPDPAASDAPISPNIVCELFLTNHTSN